ncbi:hypothetical protein BWP39_27685 [Paraburkholderia acidicola]|uniref:DUF2141 domain-containing protein n=1 Tax=Paraburkholderia acidicola TaxID=1912599 RepID=A0A2A4ET39_9BURK|nr:hypothetical protein [Paraburkholderia acidicola]PCE23464.1 hypothetical protein BWP39_27685 [Paraburkholderia acidicola]
MKKIFVSLIATLLSTAAMADWVAYGDKVTLDAVQNTLPGGQQYHIETIPAGVYRFRIDPASVGVNNNTGGENATKSLTAAMFVFNRADATHKAESFYYGINNPRGAQEIIHAVPVNAGVDLFLEEWNRADNTGSVTVIIEKWE